MSICLIDQPKVRARESARCTVVAFMIGLYDVGQCILGLLFTLNSRDKVFAGRCSQVITILGLLFTMYSRVTVHIEGSRVTVHPRSSWLLFMVTVHPRTLFTGYYSRVTVHPRTLSFCLKENFSSSRCPLDPGILFSQVTKSCKNSKHLMLLTQHLMLLIHMENLLLDTAVDVLVRRRYGVHHFLSMLLAQLFSF